MTITFENDNDVIVYALEKVISYARRTQQIFVAQFVWWLASIIGLEQGLIIHINNVQSRTEKSNQSEGQKSDRGLREVSATPRDIQEDPRINIFAEDIHPDRRDQIQITDDDISRLDIQDTRHEKLVEETNSFIHLSKKARMAAIKLNQSHLLSNT
jgi:hypothetical protein